MSNCLNRMALIAAFGFMVLFPGAGVSPVSAAPVAPTLTGPSQGATLTSFGPILAWTNPAGTTQYHLQVIPNRNDGPGMDIQIGSAETTFSIPPPEKWKEKCFVLGGTPRPPAQGCTAALCTPASKVPAPRSE